MKGQFFRIAALFAALLLPLPVLAAPAAELVVKDDTPSLVVKGKSISLMDELGPPTPVENSDLRYLAVSAEFDDLIKKGLKPGLYIITPDDKVSRIETNIPKKTGGFEQGLSADDLGEIVSGLSMSPKGDILAVSFNMSPIGDWLFFSWPDMKLTKNGALRFVDTGASVAFLWAGDHKVLVTDMETEKQKRTCEYDPCGPTSVNLFDIDTGKTTALLQGTDLCDYFLKGLEDGKIEAGKMCQPTPADWKEVPDMEQAESVSIPLP